MMKRNKGTMILTSVILLLPMVIGLIVWNKLPDQIPLHWGINGEVDGWGSKSVLVFGLPVFTVALQWLCALASSLDKRSGSIKGKVEQLVLWICPFISLLVHTLVYTKILGYDLAVEIIMPLVFGLMFIVIGNLLPKCKRNYTIGLKLPWTLKDDENWNHTHRFGGKVWCFGGAVMVVTAVFGSFVIFFAITLMMVVVPTIYSYVFYRKHGKKD